ncbi:MAG: RagB/SusD family nutrient uptake outer membrane protein [Gemmatimonadaceae bacterium]
MKTTLRYLALAALAIGVPACGKDFLTEVPADFVAPENFYGNAGDAVAAVNAAYASFINLQSPLSRDQYLGRNFWMMAEYSTEVATSRLSAANERSLVDNYHTQFTSAHPYIQGVYEAAYAGINRANSVIARVPAVPMDETRKNQIVAEAKVLRAQHYYYLVSMFGGVPLKTEETATIEGEGQPRNTAAEVFAQIYKDCTEAAAVLPTSWAGQDYGRVTKGAALTLLAKAALQNAGANGVTADYQRALDAFKQVMTLGYALDANYGSLFDGTNETSKEIIFSLQNVRVEGSGGTMTQWFTPVVSPAIWVSQQNQFQAERAFYDSYNVADKRKAATWMTTFTNAGKVITWAWTSGIQASTQYGSTGPTPRKYVDWGASASGGEAPDVIITRYADVLLSAAEAENEIAGPSATAYGYVNQVRARAGVPNLTAGLAKAAFKDSVFLERRYELALEMHGLFDNRRNWAWSKARLETSMQSISTKNASPFTSSTTKFNAAPIPDKWKLYPIPLRACELNNALTQNPGWEDGVCK